MKIYFCTTLNYNEFLCQILSISGSIFFGHWVVPLRWKESIRRHILVDINFFIAFFLTLGVFHMTDHINWDLTLGTLMENMTSQTLPIHVSRLN